MHTSPQQLSLTLLHHIRDLITAKGPISFRRFMQMALYQPGLGYYSAGLHKIGQQGDFITAPSIGSLFAKTISLHIADIFKQLQTPHMLELGAGAGQFVCDCLRTLEQLDALPEQYFILEISADLRARQEARVAELPQPLRERVVWLDALPDFTFNGVIFANEVLDALPVEVFRRKDQDWQRLLVDWQDGLQESWGEFTDPLRQQLEQKNLQLPDGYRSEFIPGLQAWLQGISGGLDSGCVLLVDYGYHRSEYYHPQRHQGTLVCHRRHQAHFEPLQDPGLQDITAFVDFTAVAEAADACGLTVAGYTTQGQYLLQLGIDRWLGLDPDIGTAEYLTLTNEVKRLVMPDQMGDKFKVMALTRNFGQALSGFENNRLHVL